MASIFRWGKKSNSRSETDRSTNNISKITDSFSTNSNDDDLFSGMEIVPNTIPETSNNANKEPKEDESIPSSSNIKALEDLDLNAPDAVSVSEDSPSSNKSKFSFLNEDDEKDKTQENKTDSNSKQQKFQQYSEITSSTAEVKKNTGAPGWKPATRKTKTKRVTRRSNLPGTANKQNIVDASQIELREQDISDDSSSICSQEDKGTPTEKRKWSSASNTSTGSKKSNSSVSSTDTRKTINTESESVKQIGNAVRETGSNSEMKDESNLNSQNSIANKTLTQCEQIDSENTCGDDINKNKNLKNETHEEYVPPNQLIEESLDTQKTSQEQQKQQIQLDSSDLKNTHSTQTEKVEEIEKELQNLDSEICNKNTDNENKSSIKHQDSHEEYTSNESIETVNKEKILNVDSPCMKVCEEYSSDSVNSKTTDNDKKVPSETKESTEQPKTNATKVTEMNYKFNVELTESEKLTLEIESLRMKENSLRDEQLDLNNKRNDIINTWKTDHLNPDSLDSRMSELKVRQVVFEEQEDYDKAAEINHQIQDMKQQIENFKYKHFLFNETVQNLIAEYQDQRKRHSTEYDEVLEAYELALKKQQTKLATENTVQKKQFELEELQLKEQKLNLERQLSHVSLDQEHINRNKSILDEEMEKKTNSLTDQKENLVQNRSEIQDQIREFELKLLSLRENEKKCTNEIDDIEKKVTSIRQEFQPRIEKLEYEMQRSEEEQTRLDDDMKRLKEKEDTIEREKQNIVQEQERHVTMIKELQSRIEELSTSSISKDSESKEEDGRTMLDNILKSDQIYAKNNDEELNRLKDAYLEIELKVSTTSEKISSEENQQNLLKRSLNDLETQLSDLQKAKQTAVKEKRYQDAKSISKQMVDLTTEGELKQKQILVREENLKTIKEEMASQTQQLEQSKSEFEKKERTYDKKIMESIQSFSQCIQEFLDSNSGSWFESLMSQQLLTNQCIIESLQKKHVFDMTELSPRSKVENEEALRKELEELETTLSQAETEENWDLAEQIYDRITTIKEQLT